MNRQLFSLSAFVAFAVLLFAACTGGKTVVGSGGLLDDRRALTPFEEIVIDAPVNVMLTSGSTQTVNVRAQGQILPILKTEVKGEKLTISMMQKAQMDNSTVIEITVPKLESLAISNSGDVKATNFSGDKLKVDLDGSGNFMGKGLNYEGISIASKGSGNIDVEGKVEDLDLDVSGSGDVNASDLMAKDVKLSSKGSGSTMLSASSKLKASMKGSGDVSYKGDPKIDLSKEGSGQLRSDN